MSNIKITLRDFFGNVVEVPISSLFASGSIEMNHIKDADLPHLYSYFPNNSQKTLSHLNNFKETISNGSSQHTLTNLYTTHPYFTVPNSNSIFLSNIPSTSPLYAPLRNQMLPSPHLTFIDVVPNTQKYSGYTPKNFRQIQSIYYISRGTTQKYIRYVTKYELFGKNETCSDVFINTHKYAFSHSYPILYSGFLLWYGTSYEYNPSESIAQNSLIFDRYSDILNTPVELTTLSDPDIYNAHLLHQETQLLSQTQTNTGSHIIAKSLIGFGSVEHYTIPGVYQHFSDEFKSYPYSYINSVRLVPEYSQNFSGNYQIWEEDRDKLILNFDIYSGDWVVYTLNTFDGLSVKVYDSTTKQNFSDLRLPKFNKIVSNYNHNLEKEIQELVSGYSGQNPSSYIGDTFDVLLTLPQYITFANAHSNEIPGQPSYLVRGDSSTYAYTYNGYYINKYNQGNDEVFEHMKELHKAIYKNDPVFKQYSPYIPDNTSLFNSWAAHCDLNDQLSKDVLGNFNYIQLFLPYNRFLRSVTPINFTLYLRNRNTKEIIKKVLKIDLKFSNTGNGTITPYHFSDYDSRYLATIEQKETSVPNLVESFKKIVIPSSIPPEEGYKYSCIFNVTGHKSYLNYIENPISDLTVTFIENHASTSKSVLKRFYVAPLREYPAHLKKIKMNLAFGEYSNAVSAKAPYLNEEWVFDPIIGNRTYLYSFSSPELYPANAENSLGYYSHSSPNYVYKTPTHPLSRIVPHGYTDSSEFYDFNNKEIYHRGINDRQVLNYNTDFTTATRPFRSAMLFSLNRNGSMGFSAPQSGYTLAFIKNFFLNHNLNGKEYIERDQAYLQTIWNPDISEDTDIYEIKIDIGTPVYSDYNSVHNIPSGWFQFNDNLPCVFFIITNVKPTPATVLPDEGKHKVPFTLHVKNTVTNVITTKSFSMFLECRDVEYEVDPTFGVP